MVRVITLLALLGAADGCGAGPPARRGARPSSEPIAFEPASQVTSAAASTRVDPAAPAPACAQLEVFHHDERIEQFATLTSAFSSDEGLAATIRCEHGSVPWLAGGRRAAAGFVVCLPPHPADGTYASELVLSLSRGAPLAPAGPRPALELIHSWWIGSSPATIVVRGDRAEARARVPLQHRTHPASFTGGVAEEIVELRGTLALK